MNKIILITIVLMTTSCSLIPVGSRSERYIECITKLTREGVRQDRIKDLCDASIDGNY